MGSSYLNKPCMLMPSTVNVSNFVSVKPCLQDEDRITNFNIWKEQMLCLIDSQGLRGFIDNREIIQPAEKVLSADDDDEEKQLRRRDRVVKGWILGSIGNDALRCVWELGSAREVWLELEKIFNQNRNVNEEDGNIEAQLKSSAPAAQDGARSTVNVEFQKTASNLNLYLPLHTAALQGNWKAAKRILDNDSGAIQAKIDTKDSTVLHVAVRAGQKAFKFVENLLSLMPDELLHGKDRTGRTALFIAASVGNLDAARILVGRVPDLLYVPSKDGHFPVLIAAEYAQRDMVGYLMSVTKDQNLYADYTGIKLLHYLIVAEFFDFALKLVEKYPWLATRKFSTGYALKTITERNHVFHGGCGIRFNIWQRFIFSCALTEASLTTQSTNVRNVDSFQPVFRNLKARLRKIALKIGLTKSIKEKFSINQDALKLVQRLCKEIQESTSINIMFDFYADVIAMAARSGTHEIIEEILKVFPHAIYFAGGPGKNIFLVAVENRSEHVYNLIYQMSDNKHFFLASTDLNRNNLLHLAAKLAPSHKLNQISGAALQMQREMQWYKEVENLIHPHSREQLNKDRKSPKTIFTEEHKKLKEEGEKWMKDTANSCTIAAALIATVMFAAAITVPGGTNSGTPIRNGFPIFTGDRAFIVFAISDAISLFTSVTSLLMFLAILTARYAEDDFLSALPRRLIIGLVNLFLAITFMMVAFSATLYLVFGQKTWWVLILVAAFAALPVLSFVLLQFPLLVKLIWSTYGPGIFSKKSNRPFY